MLNESKTAEEGRHDIYHDNIYVLVFILHPSFIQRSSTNLMSRLRSSEWAGIRIEAHDAHYEDGA